MFDSDYNRPQEEEPVEVSFRQEEPMATNFQVVEKRRPKRKRTGLKIVALCLVCALIGGVAGVGGVMVAGGIPTSTVLYQSGNTPTAVEMVTVTGTTLMSVDEVYTANVNSVVGISVDIVTTNGWGVPVTSAAAGSGFVVSADGYILTNYHVIEDANTITVSFVDGTEYEAVYVGGEADNDIAVLKVEATDLQPVVLGDSDNMKVGETVVAIGNPLGELTFSLTGGYVSALDRKITMQDGTVMNMIQSDVAINSGNSGGPLFNQYGEVIGITSAKYSTSSTSTATIEGLGFAIPINDVRDMVMDIIEYGYVTGQPFLGVTVTTVPTEVQYYGIPAGAQLVNVTPGFSAANAGLQSNDIVVAVDESTISSADGLITAVATYSAGDQATFTVYRAGETLEVTITFDEKTTDNLNAQQTYIDQQAAEEAEAEAEAEAQAQQEQQSQPTMPSGPSSR